MKRVFLVFMLCLIGLCSPLKAQDYEPVHEVMATMPDKSTVDVVWSWDKIVPQTLVVNFETGDLSQADFKNDMNFPWVITEDAYEGTYAIKSSNQGQNSTRSSIEITVDAPNDGTMSFYHKVSCEYYFDNGYFYIDGVERSLVTQEVDWEYKEFKITKGQHTYKWSFEKDESDYSTGHDTYYVDNIVLYTPEEEFEGGWIYYDDAHFVQAMSSDDPSGLTYWAISFPETEKYAGYKLTKLAYYDKNAAYITANIFLGGTSAPGELVASTSFSVNGTGKMVEVALEESVEIDGTKPLWIAFASNSYYAATACNYTGNPNSDWFKSEGVWKHMTEIGEEMGMNLDFSWIIRGYLENSRGEVVVLNDDTRAHADVTGYNLYRTNVLTNEQELVLENTQDTVYSDKEWTNLEYGVYKWGASALYGENESEIVWSNALDRDVYTTVSATVTTNSGDSPKGAKVQFVNISEPNMGYDYKVRLDDSGKYTWDKFRRGTYQYTIALEGFESCAEKETIEILDETSLECVLTEIAGAVENLYVSPTGYATWQPKNFDNGGGEFYYNFDNSTLDGWVTVDADGDGYKWRLTTEVMGAGYGYNKSKHCVISQSYNLTDGDIYGPLTPDNYLITADKYLMVEDSQLTYYVCAQDETCPAEHYAVMISTESNTDVESFTTIWEETLARGGSRGQGTWAKRTIDLGKYAGQELYIAFRHFDCTGQFYVNLDEIRLVNNGKGARAVESYTVMLDGEVVAENLTETYYQHENFESNKTYTTSIIANYTTDESDATEYIWTSVACDEYESVEEVNVSVVKGKALVEWKMADDDEQAEFETEFYYSFNDTLLNGWTVIDADGDGFNWLSSDSMLGSAGYGFKDGLYCAMSQSFDNPTLSPLNPDNYLVTEEKYLITENSKLSFYVCAQDPMYYEEHYGIAVSLLGNTKAEDFTTIWEETIESDDTDTETPQTDWEYKVIDLSSYAGEEIYIAFRHFNCTDQYMICIDDAELTSGMRSNKRSEVLGFNIYCDGELVARKAADDRGAFLEFPGDEEYEYCVRVVYSDYAMSCPQCATIDAPIICIAPEDLNAEETVNENGEAGVELIWPYEPDPYSGWLFYDDNSPLTMIGLGGTMYWGIMFPAETLGEYVGTSITKVKVYGPSASGQATVLVSYGNATNPGDPIAIKNVTFDGNMDWIEVELDQTVEITGEDNIWVYMYQTGMASPAVVSADSGDPNGRWISSNGMVWQDLASFGSQYAFTFMIRAFVTNELGEREVVALPEFNPETPENENAQIYSEPFTMTRATEFKHYNVYRGESEGEYELLATTTEGRYFDTDIEEGATYYYKVTATYSDGEVECESEPANSFKQPGKDYVVVDILSVNETDLNGLMIYPNPTRDNLTVKAENMKRITIVNAMGQVMYDQEVIGGDKDINMSQFESGVYMIRIATENGIATQRITVVR